MTRANGLQATPTEAPTSSRSRATVPPNDPHRHAVIRRAARDQFDRWAHSYDRSWLNELVFLPTVRVCQEELFRWRTLRGAKSFQLLDVGCGTGTLLLVLASQPEAELLVGLDYSPVMIDYLTAKIATSPAASKLHAVQGDSERLPFADESFDVLTCCHSFHHYPHQRAVMAEFQRVLRPGGALILVDGFRDNVVGWVVFDVGVKLFEENIHHAAWSEVRAWVREAGFSTCQQRKLNVLVPLLVTVALK